MDNAVRSEIHDLITEFAWLIDRGDSSRVAELFTETGSYGRTTGAISIGRDAIRAAYAARIAGGPRTARHIFTNIRLEMQAQDRVKGTCILTLFAQNGVSPLPADVLLVADYDDDYRLCADGRWRFESRLVSWIFTSEASKAGGLPLGTPLAR